MIRMIAGFLILMGVFMTAAWLDVAYLQHRTLFVPPPESVSEQFLRALATGRYSPAKKQLSDELSARISDADLKNFTASLEQSAGKIDDIKGLHAEIEGDRARSLIEIRTSRGKTELLFHHIRENGLWAISEL